MSSRFTLGLALFTLSGALGCRTLDAGGDLPETGNYGGGTTNGGEGGFSSQGTGGAEPKSDAASAELRVDYVEVETLDGFGQVCAGEAELLLEEVHAQPTPFGGLVSVPYVKESLARGEWPASAHVSLDEFSSYYVDRLGQADGGPVDVRVGMTAIGASSTVRVTARLRPTADRKPVHIIALTDVSESTGGSLALRDGALDGLARAIHDGGRDLLSVVAFGAPPSLVLERVDASEVVDRLGSAEVSAALELQEGSDLSAALDLASALTGPGELAHVVVLTDGGTLFDEGAMRAKLEASAEAGVMTSIIQIGRPSRPDEPVFLNADLLYGVAGWGRGVPIYLPSTSIGGVDAETEIAARYESLFPLASTSAALRVSLPAGLSAEIEDGDAPGLPIGFRSVAAGFKVLGKCDAPFTDPLPASFQISLLDQANGGAVLGETTSFTLQNALLGNGYGNKVASVLPSVVRALRERDQAAVALARGLVEAIAIDAQTQCGEVPTSCDLSDLCCARADLLALLDAAACAGGCE